FSSLIETLKALAANRPGADAKVEPAPKTELAPSSPAAAPEPVPQVTTAEPVAAAAAATPPAPPSSAKAPPPPSSSAFAIPPSGEGPSSVEGETPSQREARHGETSIRVDVGLLDQLMNLVGELVLARNQILQFGTTAKDTAFASASQRLNLITTELQEGVMKTRMQPIGNIWNKLPRIVRDLSIACGKQVRLEMEGSETELDRTIIEAIKDPLTHIVRNSVDHGIESPDVRTARGKTAGGTLFLRAFHEGGKVNIEIADDGGGIDPEKVRAKAIQRGLVTAERAARMGERELVNLVFMPGFSTAEKVSNISGRGVGMDVVKTNIEKIGGSVELSSRTGGGTTIKIKIPLTLAIIPALMVTGGAEKYAIPQVNLLELVRLDGAEAEKRVEHIHGTPVYRLRGNLLPLVYLNKILGRDPRQGQEVVNIVVLQAEDRQFGLVVDGVHDTEEIVVKPLGKVLKAIDSFAGATIMGDGRVALILDVVGIARRASVISESRERSIADATLGDAARASSDGRQTLLLLENGQQGRVALPLSLVARLEELSRSSIELVGGREVVQYRGEIMPLVRLTQLLDSHTRETDSETLQVVVYTERGRSVGLVVGRIIDIVDDAVAQKSTGARAGVTGTAVIQGRVTELLDLRAAIGRRHPELLAEPVSAAA
ncbi:MAG: chemotaxis protein CheW, partial [Myxococcales bacterium]|nr:chemotaxis protein CheW [Myxococcales bacterium]